MNRKQVLAKIKQVEQIMVKKAKNIKAYNVVRKLDKIEQLMQENGMTVEDGVIKFYKFTPLGLFSDKVNFYAGDIDKAKRQIQHINDTINSNTSGIEKFEEILEKTAQLNNALNSENIDKINNSYDELYKAKMKRAGIPDKKAVIKLIISVGKMINDLNGDFDTLDIKKIKRVTNDIEETSEKIIEGLKKQLKRNASRKKVVDGMSNLIRKRPHLLEELSGVKITNTEDDLVKNVKMVPIKGGDEDDVKKQISQIISDGEIALFTYQKLNGTVSEKKVFPLEEVKLRNGYGFTAKDLKDPNQMKKSYYYSGIQ